MSMHRIIWLRFGGRRFHLLKLAGSFFLFAFLLKALEAAYSIFVTMNKALYAQAKPDLIVQLFGWSIAAPYHFSGEDVLGVLLGPVANFLFWLALAVTALMVYQSGQAIFPIEEYEQAASPLSEHHRRMIAAARHAHERMMERMRGKRKR
ncbi:hypothetical protein HY995_05955 [Candidatus Micrarchaeota archaeon]|nr:hypothetical protein [Candidatus Micrarchaeota archaeon]MBI5177598.1 hypothetical protein [Candidatus Micrarchaeota archaeon]